MDLRKYAAITVDVINSRELDLSFPGIKAKSDNVIKPQKIVGKATGVIITTESLKGVCSYTCRIILPGSIPITEVEKHFNEKSGCIT